MKTRHLIFTILFFFSASQVMAGGGGVGDGGGGAAVVCRDASKKIISAELLDIYEGGIRLGYTIPESKGDSNVELIDAIDRLGLSTFVRARAISLAADILSRIDFLPPGVGLAAPSDLGESRGALIKDGCALEGVGFYEKNGSLKISRSIWNAFSTRNRVALVIHEALYKADRLFNSAKDSSAARWGTAAFFSSSFQANEILGHDVHAILNRFEHTWLVPNYIFWNRPYLSGFRVFVNNPSKANVRLVSAACLDLDSGFREEFLGSDFYHDGDFSIGFSQFTPCTELLVFLEAKAPSNLKDVSLEVISGNESVYKGSMKDGIRVISIVPNRKLPPFPK
jgi:hypothetical protein